MQDHLSTTFAALADPTRRAILARLSLGETSVTELAEPFAMSMPAISKHLKVLERAGLIVRGREAQWRPCRLDASPLQDASRYLDNYRRFWSTHIDALERHLDRMAKQSAAKDQLTSPAQRSTKAAHCSPPTPRKSRKGEPK